MKTGFFKAVKQNFNDLKEVLRDRKTKKNTKQYHRTVKTTTVVLPEQPRTVRNARQKALAKHKRQLARACRQANRGQGKGQKVQGRGH